MKQEISEILEKDRYNCSDLETILHILRQPDGCPWDREQDHHTIRNNFIEETYEVVEAIDNDDPVLLREELGDVLMQVVFHAEIEKEQGRFSLNDVANDVCKKLIHRHPHVFGNTEVAGASDVVTNWDKIKSQEKSRKTATDKMKAVPPSLPGLMRADKLSSVAAKYGFDFESAEQALAKVEEELEEVKSAKTPEDLAEEIGDLLFSVANYARKCGISSEEAAVNAGKKFASRFTVMETLMKDNGVNFENSDAEILDFYWNMAKKQKK